MSASCLNGECFYERLVSIHTDDYIGMKTDGVSAAIRYGKSDREFNKGKLRNLRTILSAGVVNTNTEN